MPDATVPALLPLSLLEAIRNLDTPLGDGLEELADEIVARRLGLSRTVAAQIQRYREMTDRETAVAPEEVISVLRLVGRRPDAALVLADAGRRAARYAARASGRPAWTLQDISSSRFRRRLAHRAVARVAGAVFAADLRIDPAVPEVRMAAPLSVQAVPDGTACGFYGAVFTELLRWFVGFEGTMTHERCQARGHDVCCWRAEAAEVYE